MTREELGKMTVDELHEGALAAGMSTSEYYGRLLADTATEA